MESENVAIVRRMYQSVDEHGRRDPQAALTLMDPEVEWVIAEGFPVIGGTYTGPQAVHENVLKWVATAWEGFVGVPETFLDAGDTVVVLGTSSGTYKATGKSFRSHFCHIWTLRGGKITSRRQYTDTAMIRDAMQP